jgi:hypothetical protein
MSLQDIVSTYSLEVQAGELSAIGPLVTHLWREKHPGQPLPPRAGCPRARAYPTADADEWIVPLLREPPAERQAQVQVRHP